MASAAERAHALQLLPGWGIIGEHLLTHTPSRGNQGMFYIMPQGRYSSGINAGRMAHVCASASLTSRVAYVHFMMCAFVTHIGWLKGFLLAYQLVRIIPFVAYTPLDAAHAPSL